MVTMGEDKVDARPTSTVSPAATVHPAAPAARPKSLSQQLLPAVHGLLARPLSSYYLLLASSGLLLLIGLTMVFSATSVKAYAKDGNAFSAIGKQLIFAVLGLIGFWVCQRLPAGTLRFLGRYVLGGAIALLAVLDLLRGLSAVGVLTEDPVSHIVRMGPLGASGGGHGARAGAGGGGAVARRWWRSGRGAGHFDRHTGSDQPAVHDGSAADRDAGAVGVRCGGSAGRPDPGGHRRPSAGHR